VKNQRVVLVVGAQGLLGRYVAEFMRQRNWTVFRGGRHRENQADFRYIDLADTTTFAPALQGVDMVVSTIEDHSFVLEKHIIDVGGLLVNASTLPVTVREGIRTYSRYTHAKGTVVPSGGMMGLGALIVRQLIEENPDARSLHQGWMFSVAGDLGRSGSSFVQRCLAGRRHSPSRVLDLGDRGGKKRLMELDKSVEALVCDEVLGKVEADYYIGLDETIPHSIILLFNLLRLLPSIPGSVFGSGVKKEGDTSPPSRERVTFKTDLFKTNGSTVECSVNYDGDYYSSSVVTGLFAEALLAGIENGTIEKGAYFAEEVFQIDQFIDELKKERVTIRTVR
jgi:hypothetical protein